MIAEGKPKTVCSSDETCSSAKRRKEINGFSSGLEGLSVLLLSLLFDAMMVVCPLGEGCGGVVIDWRGVDLRGVETRAGASKRQETLNAKEPIHVVQD